MSNISQNEFLSIENREKLNKLFGAHKANGKLKIELGLQELILKKKEKKKTKNGGEMIVLSFWKAPVDFPSLKTKMSYLTIDCYHILQHKAFGKFKDYWYQKFTTCLDESQFAVINKGETYLCLIGHEEKMFEKDGDIMKYEKGERYGDDIVLIEPKILKVYPPSTDKESIEINYFDLYKEL
jgi:hypothetical protein